MVLTSRRGGVARDGQGLAALVGHEPRKLLEGGELQSLYLRGLYQPAPPEGGERRARLSLNDPAHVGYDGQEDADEAPAQELVPATLSQSYMSVDSRNRLSTLAAVERLAPHMPQLVGMAEGFEQEAEGRSGL